MGRRRQPDIRIRLVETAGSDGEAVARALKTWAARLADEAQRRVMDELRKEPRQEEEQEEEQGKP